MSATDASAAADVRAALARLGAAWQARDWDALADCFDERVVVAALGAARAEGRDAVVESYREEPPSVDVWGDTAVATYRWTMGWLSGGVPNRGTGHDVLVFRRADDGGAEGRSAWRAVWRTLVSDPEPPAGGGGGGGG